MGITQRKSFTLASIQNPSLNLIVSPLRLPACLERLPEARCRQRGLPVTRLTQQPILQQPVQPRQAFLNTRVLWPTVITSLSYSSCFCVRLLFTNVPLVLARS